MIIPAYRPGEEFEKLLERLSAQKYPINKILVMNTEKKFWKETWEQEYPLVEVRHLTKEEFDHGGTRRQAAELSDAEILVFMTQDAMPADRELIGALVGALAENPQAGAAYARQLPKKDCRFLEKYTRSFNYPEQSCLKTEKDVQTYGIKTYFCSNVCAAYDHRIYDEIGGFPEHAIFNEDMVYAGGALQAGYRIAYVADACVYHSHSYTAAQQFHRNFDLGVSQAQNPQIFARFSSEGEGMQYVKAVIRQMRKEKKAGEILGFVLRCAARFAGYRMGKAYEHLPEKLILRFTSNRGFWIQQKQARLSTWRE